MILKLLYKDHRRIRYLVNADVDQMLTLITRSGDVSIALSYFG
jgi:hypothetical protein